jgi:drug/metabolite transporter superfamily protein YnfA
MTQPLRPTAEKGSSGWAIGLWFALVVPSLFITQKFLGWSGAGVYAALAGVAVAAFRRARWDPGSVRQRSTLWLAVATLGLLALAFFLFYPRVNSHVAGLGSDDDDAYNVGALALLAGRSPYLQRTYLGNVLHQLPGAFVIAAPFVLLGTSALQNLFWLPLFFVAVKVETGDGRSALRLAWLVLAFSPTVIHQVITGTGHAANTIYVLLGLWWLTRTTHRDVAAVGWGVALASRANFLLLVPLAFGWLRQRHGWVAASRAMLLTLATVAGLTLPFYLYDPGNFGPLEAADRLLRFNALVPYAGQALLLLAGALSVGLASRRQDTKTLFQNCALVQALPPVAGTVLGSVQFGRPDLAYAAYGSFFTWFALMSYACAAMYQSGYRPSFSGEERARTRLTEFGLPRKLTSG